MDVRNFIEQLKASGVKAVEAYSKALEVYSKKAVEATMKELYQDFIVPVDASNVASVAAKEPVDVNVAIRSERKRVADIKASGESLGIKPEIVEKAINDGLTLPEASVIFVDAHAKGQVVVPVAPRVEIKADEVQKFNDIAVDSLMDAAGILKDSVKKEEVRKAGNEYAPRSIHGLFRRVLSMNGVKGVDSMLPANLVEKVMRFKNSTSQGTGDFTNILANVANKALATGIEEAPVTYKVWTKQRAVKDFKEFSNASLSSFSDIELLPENSAPKHGSFTDKKEVGTLRTSGKIYTISRNALINDDLSAFTDIPRKMGVAIERAKEKECYDYLYGTSSAGPTMNEDSAAMFNATATTTAGGHGNLQTSGAAPSKTTLDAGILVIQTAPCLKGNPADSTQVTGALPRYLIAPPGLASTVWDLLAPMQAPLATYISGPNPFGSGGRCPLQAVISSYLSTLDSTGWYLATDPNEIGTITMLTLLGKNGPTMTQEENAMGSPLGLSYLIYDDWRFMAEDWRGMYCNDGE